MAGQLGDPGQIERARSVLDRSWIPEGVGEHFVRVSCDLVTGRRLEDHVGIPPSSTDGRKP